MTASRDASPVRDPACSTRGEGRWIVAVAAGSATGATPADARLLDAAAVLVGANDLPAPVDGQERPVWLASALKRGVRVAPGDRQVDFTYQPPGLRLGLGISIAAAAAALLLGLASRRTGRRERV